MICRALQRLFLERPAVAHLVHQQVRVFALPQDGRCAAPSLLVCRAPRHHNVRTQGYALSLVPVVAAHVPAARLVVPGLADRVAAAADPGDALFAVTLACWLACRHPCPATHVSAHQAAPGLSRAHAWCLLTEAAAAQAGAHAALERTRAAAAGGDVHFVGQALGALAAAAAASPQLSADVAALCQVRWGTLILAAVCLASPDDATMFTWLCRHATRRIALGGTAGPAGRSARRAHCRRRRRMP